MIEKCDVQFWCEDKEQLMIPDHWVSSVPGDKLVEGVDYAFPAVVIDFDRIPMADGEQPIIVSAR